MALRGKAAGVSFVLLLLCFGWASGQVQRKSVVPGATGRKVALVIGNSNYKNDYLGSIPAASYDADDMAEALRGLRFDEVTVRKDLGIEALISAVSAFTREARAGDWPSSIIRGTGGAWAKRIIFCR